MSRKRRKTGLAPGTVVYTGNRTADNVHTHHLIFNESFLEENVLDSHKSTIIKPSTDDVVNWYDVRGMTDVELIKELCNFFNVHPLIMEGAVDIYQRPKFEEYENGIFIIVKSLTWDEQSNELDKEHVAMFFRKGLLLSFQETESDLFTAVRGRIRASNARIRQRGADYLAHALIDSLVDQIFVLLDKLEMAIQSVEDRMSNSPEHMEKQDIYKLKKLLLQLRRNMNPIRDLTSKFSRSDNELIAVNSLEYIRSLYDHTVHITDAIEAQREVLTGLQDLYMNEVSFRMNKVMQLLTLIATIFIPLTFLAGIYGMNFEHMPELQFEYGYFVLLGIMLLVFIGLMVFFKRKKWL